MNENGNGRGPSWRWLNNLMTGMVGALVIAVGLMAWQQIGSLNQDIRDLRGSVNRLTEVVTALSDHLDQRGSQIDRLEETQNRDHETLAQCAARISVMNDWIGAQVHANEAHRKLRVGGH